MNFSKSQQFWIDHLKNYKTSGLSQVEYCRLNNIKKSSFSAQKSQLKKVFNKQNLLPTEMVPLKRTTSSTFSIKINGFELNFNEAPSPEWMAKFVKNMGANYVGI